MYKKLAVLASLAAGAVGSAHALDTKFTGWAAGSSVSVTVAESLTNLVLANGGSTMAAQAGGYNTTISNAGVLDGSFVSYCVDLGQYLSFNTNYNANQYEAGTAASFFGSRYDDVLKLFSYGYNAVTNGNAQMSAGFQIALWEMVYEKPGSYDVDSGEIRFTNSAALDEARGFLQGAASFAGQSLNLQVLTSGSNQDVAFATPVPEPGAYALMLVSLATVGVMSRRRKTG
jgi:PEP-CTERM motif